MSMNKYQDINRAYLTQYAEDLVDEAGGIPAEYVNRVKILKASTGEEEYRNPVITFSLDGIEVGFILALFNRPITYAGKEGSVYLNIDPDSPLIEKKTVEGKYMEKIWGREVELYGDCVWMKDLRELFFFYETHKEEINQMKLESRQLG